MKPFLVILACVLAASLPIDSTEHDLVGNTIRNGQCTVVADVVQCESKELSISMQYKNPL